MSAQISHDVVAEALAAVPDPETPVMVFGSYARGDERTDSDIDVLVLQRRGSTLSGTGRVSVSTYTDEALAEMGQHGSLFVLHLREEGVILRDVSGRLQTCLSAYVPPPSYEELRSKLRKAANLLDVEEREYRELWEEHNQLAVYLLRTALYIMFAERGDPIFSIPAMEELVGRDDVREAFALKGSRAPDFDAFQLSRALIEEYFETSIRNEFGSAEALITNLGADDSTVLALGLRLLGRRTPDLGYHL